MEYHQSLTIPPALPKPFRGIKEEELVQWYMTYMQYYSKAKAQGIIHPALAAEIVGQKGISDMLIVMVSVANMTPSAEQIRVGN